MPSSSAPRLSFVLPTDRFETIRPVWDRLLQQTARRQMEVVLVAPSVDAVNAALPYRGEFAALQIVAVPSIEPLGRARADGARAASAPLVFIGETHAYPNPQFVETLIGTDTSRWAAVAPSFANGNPTDAFSWSSFLIHYGRWSEGLPAGEIDEVPSHSVAFQRDMLLEMGDRLECAFDFGDELSVWMRAKGHRACIEPGALLDHVNVSRPGAWVRERILIGAVLAMHRRQHWSKARRLAYVGGAGLIPIVLLRRILPGVRRTARRVRLPWATLPLIVIGLFMQAAGEMVGYAGTALEAAERTMHRFELDRLAYVAHRRI